MAVGDKDSRFTSLSLPHLLLKEEGLRKRDGNHGFQVEGIFNPKNHFTNPYLPSWFI